MWRAAMSTAGAAAICVAGYAAFSITADADAASFEARWQAADVARKTDRIAPPRGGSSDSLITLSVPRAQTSVVMKRVREYTGVPDTGRAPVRAVPVRTMPFDPRDKEQMPIGCEPAFSPVTKPDMATVSSRCMS
jgi:hypothetical protein